MSADGPYSYVSQTWRNEYRTECLHRWVKASYRTPVWDGFKTTYLKFHDQRELDALVIEAMRA